jgi:glycosyltransferase involved in cell wall biosynthesis
MVTNDQPSDARTSQQPASGEASTIASVLLVTPTWGRDGGVATHVQASASALAEHGLAVHVLAARIRSEDAPPGVTLHHRPALLDRSATLAARLGDFHSLRPSVVHFHQRDEPEMVDLMRRTAPVAISAHGYPGCTSGVYYFTPGHECTRAHGLGCVPNLIARGCAHTRYPRTLPLKYKEVTRGLAALGQADVVISYSSAVDRHLAANRLRRRAIVPLFPTLPTSEHRAQPVQRRVVFAGRVEQPKGLAVLIHAVREVEGELVVCGEGRQLQAMQALTRELGVQARVHFAGWLEPAPLARELASAAVVVVPSLWPEPFGLVGIEALALGRPVIASATGGILDWLREDVSIGVAPGDTQELARALAELLADPARQQAMGAAGRALVDARFSPARHVEALLDSYRAAQRSWSTGGRHQTDAAGLIPPSAG